VSSLVENLDSLALVGLDVSSSPEIKLLIAVDAFVLDEVLVGLVQTTLELGLGVLGRELGEQPAAEGSDGRSLFHVKIIQVSSVLVLREDELGSSDEEAAHVLILRADGVGILGELSDAGLLGRLDLSL